jgi:hypothetical protein
MWTKDNSNLRSLLDSTYFTWYPRGLGATKGLKYDIYLLTKTCKVNQNGNKKLKT